MIIKLIHLKLILGILIMVLQKTKDITKRNVQTLQLMILRTFFTP